MQEGSLTASTPTFRAPWTTVEQWRSAFHDDYEATKTALLSHLRELDRSDPAWISILDEGEVLEQFRVLEERIGQTKDGAAAFPLLGVPFAAKDNIDAIGMATTAACPAFAYQAEKDATVVSRLKAAGAVLLGKTNLDQFATGLVGTRSPYGAVPNTFQAERISGGSSSGSASVVARGLVPFSLGTDTAGSGRVPASFNNLVGLKPTRGALSAHGVVPACRSLDCVSIFALTVEDAEAIYQIARGFDTQDAYSREAPDGMPGDFPAKPVFAIPSNPKWFGDTLGEQAFTATLKRLEETGAVIEEVDFSPMYELALLLYNGPWVAERLEVIEDFLKTHAEEVHPVIRGIIEKGRNFTAVDTYRAEYRRKELSREIHAVLSRFDAFLVPTAPTFPTTEEVLADPVEANSRLGTYTNFVNLADCSALALPAGFRGDGLPFGITLIAPAWRDKALITFGKRWTASLALPLGATGVPFPPSVLPVAGASADTVRLAVVGAHLTGMPLNSQLTERNARFIETSKTSAAYRLFALPETIPPKPGLSRVGDGAPIEVELWDMPLSQFGSFVALIPPPLGIGTLELIDGRQVKGFICENHALTGARDITSHGGWRAYTRA